VSYLEGEEKLNGQKPIPRGQASAPEAQYEASYEEDEIDLLDLALVLVKHKRLIIGTAFLAGLVALILGFIMTPIYRAETHLVPPQLLTVQSSAVLSPGLRSIASQFGFGNVATPADLITGIVKSRTIIDRIIDKFDLMNYYNAKNRDNARKTLSEVTSAKVDEKSGLITVAVEDKDPALAADITNAFVAELQDMVQNLAITQVSQQRLFLENQLKRTHHNLIQAEEDFQKYQMESGFSM